MIGEPESWEMGDFPTGSKLDSANAPKEFVGDLRTSPEATDQNIDTARRYWPQARLEDFDRDGKIWVDCATGERYRMAPGNPLLAMRPRAMDVATFLVFGDSLVFLRLDRSQSPVEDSIPIGTFPGVIDVKPKPWWETYPREYWTAEDWAAYHRATGVPSAYEPSGKALVPPGKLVANFDLFPQKPKPNLVDPVDELLGRLGIRKRAGSRGRVASSRSRLLSPTIPFCSARSADARSAHAAGSTFRRRVLSAASACEIHTSRARRWLDDYASDHEIPPTSGYEDDAEHRSYLREPARHPRMSKSHRDLQLKKRGLKAER